MFDLSSEKSAVLVPKPGTGARHPPNSPFLSILRDLGAQLPAELISCPSS